MCLKQSDCMNMHCFEDQKRKIYCFNNRFSVNARSKLPENVEYLWKKQINKDYGGYIAYNIVLIH